MEQKSEKVRVGTRDLEDLVQRHADALVSGRDIAPELTNQNPSSARALSRLFGLTRRLNESFSPVEPSRNFVSDLKSRLAEAHAVSLDEQKRHAQRLRTAIGTGVGALIVIALLARLVGTILMVVAFLARLRRRSVAT
jgi:hypothetical protein